MTGSPTQVFDSRRIILRALLKNKHAGLTLDELSESIGITRTAVRQHVGVLERDGLVAVIGRRDGTGGRPSRTYGLTNEGIESFPRRYDMLAEGMLNTVREELGEAGLDALLARMADDLSAQERDALEHLPTDERRAAVVEIMNALGYDARLDADGSIVAVNCIFHKLAAKTRAVCRYDERLLSQLLGHGVKLTGCMQDGHDACAFAASRDEDEAAS